jgi:bifunctional non-homologous end joining protein LigD
MSMEVAGVFISNPDRVLYQEQGLTKYALASYYDAIASLMVPHVAERPLVLVRCPQGRHKTCFYQKHWTTEGPEAIDTVPIREESGKVMPYAVVRDGAGPVALVQHGVLETHVWGSRADNIEAPDRIVFDLDPSPEVPWRKVVDAAKELCQRLRDLGLKSWLKTTGGKGLHVVVPLARRSTWNEVTAFSRAVATAMVADSPGQYIAKASKAERKGRIFVDWLRNARGATWIAPWSTRSRPNAPISVPVAWDEVDQLQSSEQYNVGNIPDLLTTRWWNPWADLPKSRQSLTRAMQQAVTPKPQR